MDGIEREINLKKFLTPLSRDTEEMQAIAGTETVELQELWEVLCDVFDNQFLPYMTGYGLSQWESIFDEVPKAGASLNDRRKRIMALRAGSRPYTLERFQMMVDLLFGEGNARVILDGDNYLLTFDINTRIWPRLSELRNFAEEIVPKNLIISVSHTTNVAADVTIACSARLQNHIYVQAATDVSIDTINIAPSISARVAIGRSIYVGARTDVNIGELQTRQYMAGRVYIGHGDLIVKGEMNNGEIS